jgi:hypothetical protein
MPFSKGRYSKLLKIFSRTSKSILIQLDANHLWIKEIQVQIKGYVLFKGEIISKLQIQCIGFGHVKNKLSQEFLSQKSLNPHENFLT